MSDGAEVSVTVRSIGGKPVRAKVRATDDGYVAVVDLPPTLIMDPLTDVPEMKRALDAVTPVALRKRDEKRARDAGSNKR